MSDVNNDNAEHFKEFISGGQRYDLVAFTVYKPGHFFACVKLQNTFWCRVDCSHGTKGSSEEYYTGILEKKWTADLRQSTLLFYVPNNLESSVTLRKEMADRFKDPAKCSYIKNAFLE